MKTHRNRFNAKKRSSRHRTRHGTAIFRRTSLAGFESLETRRLLTAGPLMEYRLQLEDLSNNPITTVTTGQDFKLAVFGHDLRTNPQPPDVPNVLGVFQGSVQVAYPTALVSVNSGSLAFASFFGLSQVDHSTTTPGVIDASAASTSLTAPGSAEQLLWTVTLHANAAGAASFISSLSTLGDSLLYGLNGGLVPADQIQFDSAPLTINGPPSVSLGNVSLPEGNSGNTNFVFAINLSAASNQQVTVNFATANGTATTANNDYLAFSGILTFAPGDTTKFVTIPVVGDTTVETDETFSVVLSNPINATLGTATGTGTIQNDDLPSVGVANVSQLEGDSGQTPFVFTVTLSQPSPTAVLVPFQTSDGSATTADNDYQANSGTLTFAAGSTTAQVVTVLVNGDTLNELNETFHLTLTSPTNALFDGSNGSALGTILNDDGSHISFTQPSVAHLEGDSGTTAFVFTVNIGVASGIPITVNFTTQDGTAAAGSDYTAISGTLTFAPSDISKDVTVLVNGDTLNEADETFTLNLSNATNATVSQAIATGTIQNDDPAPSLSISTPASQNEGNLGTTPMLFTVSLSAASGQAVAVQLATHDGTATVAGNDYQAIGASTLTFAPGETQKVITVNIVGDTANELDETFSVALSNPTNATLSQATATGTILNDDPVPSLTIGDISQAEGNSGTTNFVFTATLSAASGQTVTVAFTTADGTATLLGQDYLAKSGTLTFSPGQTSQAITVQVLGDTLNEPVETFSVNLSLPVNVTLAKTSATGTIQNDDPPPTVSIANAAPQNEGNSGTTPFVFTVTLSAVSGQEVDIAFATADGTATTANSDYVATSGTLTFAAGETTHSITVLVNGDTLNEADETFKVNLVSPTNATLGTATATGTIVNDDPVPSISIGDFSHLEGDSGTTPFVFSVTLSASSGQITTVAFSTADGTATTANNDYQATSGTLTFAPGTTTQNVTVQVVGDLFLEPDETFFVKLSNPANATLQNTQGTGTILNDPTDNITFTPSQLSGTAFVDVNKNGAKEAGENPLSGVAVALSGTSQISGHAVNAQATTAADGSYTFSNLDPGTYTVTYVQPAKFLPASVKVGSQGGQLLSDAGSLGFTATIASPGGVQGINNNLTVPGLRPEHISQRSFLASSFGASANSNTATLQLAPSLQAASVPAASLAIVPDLVPQITAAVADTQSASTSSGAATDAITQTGSSVTVHGTSGDDVFQFVAGAMDTVTINGLTRQLDPAVVDSIVFDGGAGTNTATLTGSAGNDVAAVGLGSGTLSGPQFKVSVSNVANLSVKGGGGHDTATLQDSASSDHLQAAGNEANLANDLGFAVSLMAFDRVLAQSTNGGTDTAHVGATDFILEQVGTWLPV
jgi:hypothetical protein